MLAYSPKKLLSKYGIWLIFLFFLLATSYFLYEKSFDNQEIDYLRISHWSVKKIIFENWGDQLPLWFVLAKTYIGIFGKSEIALKMLSIGAFLLSAFVLYKLCEIYSLNKYLITTLFLFNPLLLKEIALTFKHWSFLILTSLLVLYFFEKYKNSKRKKYLFFLFLAIFAGMYSNLIFLIFFLSFAVYALINLFSKQISFKFFILFIIISIILCLPLFYYYEKAKHQLLNVQGGNMDWGISERGFDFIKLSLSHINGINYLNNNTLSIILGLSIVSLFIFQIFFERDKKFIYLKIWSISTVFFILLAIMIMADKTPVTDRYFALAVPFLYLAIFPKYPKFKKKYYSLAIILISFLILLLSVFSSWQMIEKTYFDNWKGVASFLQPKIKENTQILILYKFQVGNFLMEYYLKKPATRLPELNDISVLYSDDIWIIRRHGNYDAIYKTTDKYDIKEYNNFKPIKIFHLTRKNPRENNSLIFNSPLIEIEKSDTIQKIPFSNGSSSAWSSAEDWQQIRISAIKSGGAEKICLFAHPRNEEKINIVYKNIELEETIKIFTGIADGMTGGNLSPVYMDVYINDIFLKKVVQPDKWSWLTTKIDTNLYKDKLVDIKFTIYADNDKKRHFCFDAEITNENDYFYQNIKKAIASVDNELCEIYKESPIFSHNEKKPPFAEAAIFDRWDCEEKLVSKNKIWNTVGKSYAVSGNEFKEAIWFHPETDKIKTLEYKNINLEVKKIKGFYGLNDLAISNKIEKAALTFTISANGEKIYEDKFNPVKGWKNFEIPFNPVRNSTKIQTGQFNDNKISNGVNKNLNNVIFSITTTDDRWNHFFFNAFLSKNNE